MKEQKNLLFLLAAAAVIVIVGFLLFTKGFISLPLEQGIPGAGVDTTINNQQSVYNLDSDSKNLDNVDLDEIDSELNDLNSEATGF